MEALLHVLLVLLNVVNIVLHSIGFSLLTCLKNKSSQLFFLLNLSASELLKNVALSLTHLPKMLVHTHEPLTTWWHVQMVSGVVYDYTIMFSYYLTMFAITADRYFIILNGKKYQCYWNITKTKYSIVTTWSIGIIISVVLLVTSEARSGKEDHVLDYFIYRHSCEAVFTVYTSPIIDTAFIILAIAVYYKIFTHYARSTRRCSKAARADNKTDSALKLFAQSRFFIAVLLISSFIAFTIIPDLILSYYKIRGYLLPHKMDIICNILFAITDLVDVFIYVFVQKKVRRLLWNKLRRLPFCPRKRDLRQSFQLYTFSDHVPGSSVCSERRAIEDSSIKESLLNRSTNV